MLNDSSKYHLALAGVHARAVSPWEKLDKLGFKNPQRARVAFSRLFSDHALAEKQNHHTLAMLIAAFAASFDSDQAIVNLEALLDRLPSCYDLTQQLYTHPHLAEVLAALLSASTYLTTIILHDPTHLQWLLQDHILYQKRSTEALQTPLQAHLNGLEESDYANYLRQFKKREYLRIGLRDLLKLADTPTTLRELSQVADICLESAYRYCHQILVRSHGNAYFIEQTKAEQGGQFVVIGMGKLGGQELNFSSDIDLIYVYNPEKGYTSGVQRPGQERTGQLPNYRYFARLAQMITATINEITVEGGVFRVDLRLRPEGKAGAVALPLHGYRRHYWQRGQVWERQALIKGRQVAGDSQLAQAFLEMVKPFIFRSQVDPGIFQQIEQMRRRLKQALIHRNADHLDVKLGYGGIREIEFLVQGLQLVYGGARGWPWVRTTLDALDLLADEKLLVTEEHQALREAYLFFRDLENRIQMTHGVQTHLIPSRVEEQAVLAKKMALDRETEEESPTLLAQRLLATYRAHTQRVRQIYSRRFPAEDKGVGLCYVPSG